MVCQGLEALQNKTITSIMQYPLTCDYYFYAKIFAAFFVILTLLLYKADKENLIKADMISCMGVSAVATIFIAIIGSVIGIIAPDILIEIIVIGIILIAIWMFKK